MGERLTYVQLTSIVNHSFWSKLTELKLNIDKLKETEHHLWGYFSYLQNSPVSSPVLEVDSTSFNEEFNSQSVYIPFEGKIFNKNTIERFKECNKTELLNAVGADLSEKIFNGQVLRRPSLLNSFLILTFADLKKYHYYYWFAFPVPYDVAVEKIVSVRICETLPDSLRQALLTGFTKLDDLQKPYFIIDAKNDGILRLEEIKSLTSDNMDHIYFTFLNISHSEGFVGSQLRNFVLLIAHHCPFLQGTVQKFIALHFTRFNSKISIDNSVIYNLKLPKITERHLRTWVAWEKNERGKMGPRMANMKNTLDPQILAESAVDLNLKLMKWRALPEIDLEKIKNTRCLLLGSGTLGCSVARCLLAWGIRNITFVDNSNVSFSNPVRQNLFTYEDSVKMKPKSEAAAERLKEVFPGVVSKGVQLNIPMPGHNVGDSLLHHTITNVTLLIDLIKEADLIFLLMDSRESRWLPTMLGSFYNKIVINAALGFDTYLVMRHGCRSSDEATVSELCGSNIQGQQLGCYFCNDVTAPGDSMRNRSLDQQCTVTRPGISQIAAALAVELAVSVLQHKDGCEVFENKQNIFLSINAPAFYKNPSNFEEMDQHQSLLGVVPHSIRGFLSTFTQIQPATAKFDRCVACSTLVFEEYRSLGNEFLVKVFNSPKYLEEVTKLTEMLEDVNLNEVLELDDDLSE